MSLAVRLQRLIAPWRKRVRAAFLCAVLLAGVVVLSHLVRWEILSNLGSSPLWLLLTLQAAILLLALAALGRWVVGVAVWLFGVELVRALSSIKFRYLASPIDAGDIRQFDVVSIFQTLTHYPEIVLWVFLGFGAVVVAVSTLRGLGPVVSWRWRLMAVFAALLLLNAQYQFRRDFSPPADAMNSTSLSALVQSFFLSEADLPVPQVEVTAPRVSCPARAVNVAVVLEESTFKSASAMASSDPVLSGFFTGDVYSGPLRVHVFGGKTHLSDFAFLVGVPHLAMSGANEYLSRTLAGRVNFSLPQILRHCGYESTVIYPISKGYFNSYEWFRSVGFDHVIAPEDVGLGGAGRWRVADNRFLDEALKVAASAKRPQLIYVLTIAQHGPHDLQGDPAEEYHRRLMDSASAFDRFQRGLALRGGSGPWLVGWFGDHRPFRVEEADAANRYTTWATLRWVRPAEGVVPVQLPAAADISFFSRMIQRVVGVDTGRKGEIEDLMMQTCPSGYFDCPLALRTQHQLALRASGAVLAVGKH